ncbi:hypothetical protein [Rhodanobacter sp. FW106-PBR-R2A-1-13]|uniref:hypothetical protein n=1 Tax=Rhodanobacter sp. FW106-PBR-R2A-1-13 TaxID=3454845 RepID=UPI0034E55B5C
MSPTELFTWVVYDHPRDMPDVFVARQWRLTGPTSRFFTAPTLDALREKLPAGLTCLPRSPDDDSVIVETWL